MKASGFATRGGVLIDVRERGGFAVVTLRGRLDIPFERDLVRALEKSMGKGLVNVIIDCEGLEYLGSRGVSAFIAVIDDLRARGGDLKLVGLSLQASLVLDRLGVSRLIQCFAYLDAAMQTFGKPVEQYMGAEGLDVFIATPEGSIFHASGCVSARRILEPVTYPSKDLASRAGLRPCLRCCV